MKNHANFEMTTSEVHTCVEPQIEVYEIRRIVAMIIRTVYSEWCNSHSSNVY